MWNYSTTPSIRAIISNWCLFFFLKHPTNPEIKAKKKRSDGDRQRRKDALWLLAHGNQTPKRWHYQHVGWEIHRDCFCLYFWRCGSICVCMCVHVCVCLCATERNGWCRNVPPCAREKCWCKKREWRKRSDFSSHISQLIRAHHLVIQLNCKCAWRCYSGDTIKSRLFFNLFYILSLKTSKLIGKIKYPFRKDLK